MEAAQKLMLAACDLDGAGCRPLILVLHTNVVWTEKKGPFFYFSITRTVFNIDAAFDEDDV